MRQQTVVKLFLCATNVQTAKIKIFLGKDIGLERLLASTSRARPRFVVAGKAAFLFQSRK